MSFLKKNLVKLFILMVYFTTLIHIDTQAYTTSYLDSIEHSKSDMNSLEEIKQQIYKLNWNNAAFLEVVETPDRIDYSDDDLFCMAKNIYHEAGNQDILGKFAVAQVTINRMNNIEFADTICDVVYQPHQFSWTSKRKLRYIQPIYDQAWIDSVDIARKTLQDGYRVKGMQNALYFHANYVNVKWKKVYPVAHIGSHIFYEQS